MLPIIKQTGEVVGRDSGSTTATASDLYTALSENESVWGFFKRFQCELIPVHLRTMCKS